MLVKNDIVISDTCILIDLVDLNLIEDIFHLSLNMFTTPSVIDEIIDQGQLKIISKHLDNQNIILDQMGDDDVIFSIFNENPGLSLVDSAVLELAIRRNGILLSSDKSLRNESRKRSIIVQGTLWIIKKLEESLIISTETALEKLNRYPKVNQRTPKREIDELIVNLKCVKK